MVVRNRRLRETAPGHSQKTEAKCFKKLRLEKVATKREKKKDEQDWRMMQLPNGSVWPCRCTKKENQDRIRS